MGSIGLFQIFLILIVLMVIIGGPVVLVVFLIKRAKKGSDNRQKHDSDRRSGHLG